MCITTMKQHFKIKYQINLQTYSMCMIPQKLFSKINHPFVFAILYKSNISIFFCSVSKL